MNKIIKVQVERGDGNKNFACFSLEKIGDYGLKGFGSSAHDCIDDFMSVVDEVKDDFKTSGKIFPDVSFDFIFDVGSLFDYYSYLNISGVAKKMGINASLMRQYAIGNRRPSDHRLSQIKDCLLSLSDELHNVILSNAH